MSEGVDREWQRLVDALGTIGEVTATDLGLSIDLEHRTVELVMTADRWNDFPVVHGGYPIDEILDQIRSQPVDVRFLVYNGQYEFEPCVTPFIPPHPEQLRLEELRRLHPNGIPGFGWYAYPPGDPRHERGLSGEPFADWVEPADDNQAHQSPVRAWLVRVWGAVVRGRVGRRRSGR